MMKNRMCAILLFCSTIFTGCATTQPAEGISIFMSPLPLQLGTRTIVLDTKPSLIHISTCAGVPAARISLNSTPPVVIVKMEKFTFAVIPLSNGEQEYYTPVGYSGTWIMTQAFFVQAMLSNAIPDASKRTAMQECLLDIEKEIKRIKKEEDEQKTGLRVREWVKTA